LFRPSSPDLLDRDRRQSGGLGQRTGDRFLDRTLHAAESIGFSNGQPAAGPIIGIEPLRRETEQRQRVGTLCVGNQPLGQSGVDG
jgi:hypothetical protein